MAGLAVCGGALAREWPDRDGSLPGDAGRFLGRVAAESLRRDASADGPREAEGGASIVYEQVVDGQSELFVVSAAGGVPRRLTTHPAQDRLPRFSHDGTKVLFTSNRSGNWQVWEVDALGGVARRVMANPHREWQVDESPDGSRLAFLSTAGGPEQLWILNRRTGRTRRLVDHGDSVLGNPDWSPDGRRVAFSSNVRLGHHIYVVDVDGGGEPERLSPLLKGGCEPRFSPDGTKVLYTNRGGRSKASRIVEHDLATGAQRVIVDWDALNYDVAYAPDGQEIAFASNLGGQWAVYRYRLSDGTSWRVTDGRAEARYPDYRPR